MQTTIEYIKKKKAEFQDKISFEAVGYIQLKNLKEHSNIKTVRIFQQNRIEVLYKVDEKSTNLLPVVLQEGRLALFYQKCLQESEKAIDADPKYILSNEIINKIAQYHLSTISTDYSKKSASQLDINLLYERYYKEINAAIQKKSDEPLIILLGEKHYSSLLHNLIVFEIVNSSGKFKHFFIEQAEGALDFYKKCKPYQNIAGSSFLYLSLLADFKKIPVSPVESRSTRAMDKLFASHELIGELTLSARNKVMAEGVKKLSIDGIVVLLCGRAHIPGMIEELNSRGANNLLALDRMEFLILEDPKQHKDAKREKAIIFSDASELHARVLKAQSVFNTKLLTKESILPEEGDIKHFTEIKGPSTPKTFTYSTFFSPSSSPSVTPVKSEIEQLKSELREYFNTVIPTKTMFLKDYLQVCRHEIEDLSTCASINEWCETLKAQLTQRIAMKSWLDEEVRSIIDKLDLWIKPQPAELVTSALS